MFLDPEKAFFLKNSVEDSPLQKNEQVFFDLYLEKKDGRKEKEQFDLLEYKKKYQNFSIEDFEGLFDKSLEGLSVENMEVRNMKSVDDMIDHDKRKIDLLRKKEGQKYKTDRAMILEALLSGDVEVNAESAGWFGDDVVINKTTEYDDRINHADFVIELGLEGDSPKVAIDCTIAENKAVLKEKADRIMRDIYNNKKLGNIKYYEDESAKAGPLRMIPRAIVAIDKTMLEELCEDYMIKPDRFSRNFVQILVLKEIKIQLEKELAAVHDLREDINNSDFQIMENNIKKALQEIDNILEDKKNSLPERTWERAQREMKNSNSFKAIAT